MGFVKRFGHDEKGVLESSLVMIPLVLLFLITMGLVAAVNLRNIDASLAQSDASVSAITGSLNSSDEIVTLTRPGSRKGMRIVIARRSRPIPGFGTHLLLTSNLRFYSTDAVGIAVMEENP